jgi:hypothetical protein
LSSAARCSRVCPQGTTGVQGLTGGKGVQGPHHRRQGEQGKHQRLSLTKRKVKLGLGAGTAATTPGLGAVAEHSSAAGVPTSVRTCVYAEGPIRRTREGGSEWEPIKILLDGDGDSNKMNTTSNTRLLLTTKVGQAHVATGVPLDLGTNTQPSDPRNAVENQSSSLQTHTGQTGEHQRSDRSLLVKLSNFH